MGIIFGAICGFIAMRCIRKIWGDEKAYPIFFLLWVVILVVVMAGCGQPAPDEGYIKEKRFTPAHWEDGYRTEYYPEYRRDSHYVSGTDSTPGHYEESCGIENVAHQVYEAHHNFVEDDWDFRLEDCKTNDEGERKCNQGWHDVTEQEFDSYKTGQHYPDPA